MKEIKGPRPLGSQGAVRLAPFYDLASVLPYKGISLEKAKLAMKIGGEYRLRNIGVRNWQKCAADLRIDGARLIERIQEMAVLLAEHATTIEGKLEAEGLSHRILGQLAGKVQTRASTCLRLMSCGL